MAYLDTQHTHKRLAGMTGVAAIHVVLAVGLVAGLSINYVAPPAPLIIEGGQIPFDPPPPPPPPEDTPDPVPTKAETAPQTTPIYVPEPTIAIPTNTIVETTFELPPLGELVTVVSPTDGTGTAPIPEPPAFTPSGPAPNNGPAGWVTTNDYPLRALQRGWEGDVHYALEVGTDGRVDDCRVVNTSGRSVLDVAACRRLKQRARFDPAMNSDGEAIAGTFTGTVSWLIPERR